MASCYAGCTPVGVSAGTSGGGVSAYIDRGQHTRDLTGETFDFRNHKSDEPVLDRGLELPPGSPQWDKQRLWDEVDKAEIARTHLARTGEVRLRDKAQLAKHYVYALPIDKEVTDAQRIEMARLHIKEQFTDNGLPAQWAIHMQEGNPHLHVLVPTRRLGPEGLAKTKATDLNPEFARGPNGKAYVSEQDYVSEKWEAFQNRYFEEQGLDLRVDSRGVVPQIHEGKARHIEGSWKRAENEARLADAQQTAKVEPETVLERLTDKQTTFTERDLNRLLKKAGLEDMAERETAKQQALSHPDCVKLYDANGQETGLYSTEAVRREEHQVMDRATKIMGRDGGQVSDQARNQALKSKTLDPEQREAFDVMTARNRLCVIQGRAGAGKSYTMGAAREAFEADGWRVVGLAPTNTVSRDMQKDGFKEASTVHSELLRQEGRRTNPRSRAKAWDSKTVVFVDEAAMLDNKTLNRFLEQVEQSGAKVVMVGDDVQLASIQRGGMYTEIRHKSDQALISQVRRQEQDWMKQASMNLADGKVEEAIQAYREHGCIRGTNKPVEGLLIEWKRDVAQNPDANRFIYAGTNAEVNRINDECSRTMREMGRVQEGITYECKKGVHEFKQTIGVGDRIQFNATAKNIDSNLINGNFGTVEKASLDSIKVKLDSGASVSFNPKEFNGFALGYSGTVYKGQGKTQTDVYALHGPTWSKRTTYVGATRHKGEFKLYVDTNKIKNFGQLTRNMSQGQERPSTLNYLDEKQAQARHAEIAVKARPQAQARPEVKQEAAAAPKVTMEDLQKKFDEIMARISVKPSQKPTQERKPQVTPETKQAETAAPQIKPQEQDQARPEVAPGATERQTTSTVRETPQAPQLPQREGREALEQVRGAGRAVREEAERRAQSIPQAIQACKEYLAAKANVDSLKGQVNSIAEGSLQSVKAAGRLNRAVNTLDGATKSLDSAVKNAVKDYGVKVVKGAMVAALGPPAQIVFAAVKILQVIDRGLKITR